MSLFTGDVERVSATRIFARREGPRQALIYSTSFSAANELAIVLPLPVAKGEVELVALDGYAGIFDDLEEAFPRDDDELDDTTSFRGLEVHEVGAFEASFVPSRADLARLDPRFRLPESLWKALPAYRDYGFAVFKLKPGRARLVHPLALWFPTRLLAGWLFFPTVHLDDGTVPSVAQFDHTLYAQAELAGWKRASVAAGRYVDARRARDLVSPAATCARKRLRGPLPNADVIVREMPGASSLEEGDDLSDIADVLVDDE